MSCGFPKLTTESPYFKGQIFMVLQMQNLIPESVRVIFLKHKVNKLLFNALEVVFFKSMQKNKIRCFEVLSAYVIFLRLLSGRGRFYIPRFFTRPSEPSKCLCIAISNMQSLKQPVFMLVTSKFDISWILSQKSIFCRSCIVMDLVESLQTCLLGNSVVLTHPSKGNVQQKGIWKQQGNKRP